MKRKITCEAVDDVRSGVALAPQSPGHPLG
jgi:hypothetical protein